MNLTFKEKTQRFVTTKVLDSIIQKARSGDLTDLARLFENIAALAPASYHRKTFRKSPPWFGRITRMRGFSGELPGSLTRALSRKFSRISW